jgi:hypothetical protein
MDDGITDEMLRAGTAAMWGSPERNAAKIARMVLEAALAGRTVVDLPEPDGRTYGGSVRWDASARRIIAKVDEQGRPFIRIDGQIWLVGEAESVGLALVAAAREAQRQATRSDDAAALPGDTPQRGVVEVDDPGVNDDYWTSEPIENSAVAEWWRRQPESGTRSGVST